LQADEHAVLLYDADCGICTWFMAKVLAWDRRCRLRPVALQDPEAERLLAGMDEAVRISSWHLVAADGQVHSAGTAFGPLLGELPGGAPLAALASRFPGAAERGYRLVAERRALLGRLVTDGAARRAARRVAERSAGSGLQ
jgi:predicted DCC family thiol-disulfide oxidoreductase YuxK